MNMPEAGHQSPPPERSSGRQMKETPASGQGTDDSSRKDQTNTQALKVCKPNHLFLPLQKNNETTDD